MKVLHILAEIKYSGAEVMLTRAADIMKENGISLFALSTGKQLGNYAPIMTNSGYICKHIPFKKSPSFFRNLYTYLKIEQFDAVHIHSERASLWIALIAKLTGCKIIVRTYHSSFTFSGFLRIRRICTRWITRLIGIRNIAIGDSVAKIEKYNLLNPCSIVYNWTDDSKFYPAKSMNEIKEVQKDFSIPCDSFVISSVGSCNHIKRHDLIVQAIKDATNQGLDIYYLHAGEGALNDNEKELAKKLGVSDKISFLGQCDDVRKVLIASDLYVMPSTYEGFGISCLEALKCGIPALVSDVPGLRDIVKDGKNGYLCQPEEFSEKLISLVNKEKICKEVITKSVCHFSIRDSVQKMVTFYI